MSKQEKQDRALAAEWVEVAKAAKRLHAAARAAAASVPATDGNMLAHSQAHSLVTRLGKLTTAAAAMDLQLIRKTLARVEPRVREAAFSPADVDARVYLRTVRALALPLTLSSFTRSEALSAALDGVTATATARRPLHDAAADGDATAVRHLMTLGASANKQSAYGRVCAIS